MPRQFLYNGHAVGFAGRIRAPFEETIEAQAPSTLGADGGYSSARVENFRRHEIFSFASAHTQVSGIFSQKSQSFETLVSGVLEGLNIVDLVKADYIGGRLMSRHPDVPAKGEPDEPFITPVGSHFGKLVVAGFELKPVIDVALFNQTCSYTSLRAEFGKNKDLCARFSLDRDEPKLPPPSGLLLGSIVSEIQGGGPGLVIERNMVHVPGFGKLFFGEFGITQYSRRLVMLRAELGCPLQGGSSGPDMGGNGQPPS